MFRHENLSLKNDRRHKKGTEFQHWGGTPSCSLCKGELNTKIHLVVDPHGIPVRVIITKGTRANCTQAGCLIEGSSGTPFDSDAILSRFQRKG